MMITSATGPQRKQLLKYISMIMKLNYIEYDFIKFYKMKILMNIVLNIQTIFFRNNEFPSNKTNIRSLELINR